MYSDFNLTYLNREKISQQQVNNNEEIYTALWNDWDLDAAFMNSSEPYLCVLVDEIIIDDCKF